MIELRPSEMERVFACPASLDLPRLREDPSAPSPSAEEGTAIHEHIARILTGRNHEKSISMVNEKYRRRCLPITKGVIYETLGIHAHDVLYVERKLSKPLGHGAVLAGTPDLLIFRSARTIWQPTLEVVDWKCGDRPVTSPATNPQVLSYVELALEFARVNDVRVDVVRGSIVTVGPDGSLDYVTEKVDRDEFGLRYSRIADDKLAMLMVQPDGQPARPTYRTGRHCTYCPSVHVCPPHNKALIALGKNPTALADHIEFSPEASKDAYDKLALVRRSLVAAEKQLAMYARENPIEMGDGVVYGEARHEQRVVQANVAHDVLDKMHGCNVALDAMTLSTSEAEIGRALKRAHPDIPLAPMLRDVMQAIDASGGRGVKTSANVKLHRPKAPAAVETDEVADE